MLQSSTAPTALVWPGAGTGAKTDAYAPKFLIRHEKQYSVFASHKDMQPFLDAEGGIVCFEKFAGQRLVLFQGSWLSNFQPAVFSDSNGVVYNCTEQAFQAAKALFVAAHCRTEQRTDAADAAMDVYRKIMKSTNPLYQKLAASAKYLPMDQDMRDMWMNMSTEVMLQLNRLKFAQNQHLKRRLLALDGAIIFEAAPDDSLWGIGMAAQTAVAGPPPDLDPAAPHAAALEGWRGLDNMTQAEIDAVAFPGRNRLGRVLEHVRGELLAGRQAPLAHTADDAVWAAGAVAELLRGALGAEDESSTEKQSFYARVAAFVGAAGAAA